MATGIGTITELRLEADGLSARITYPAGMRPSPGQYLSASSPNHTTPLPVVLFASAVEPDVLVIAPPLPHEWSVGMNLKLRGPLGKGFQLPLGARRVAAASLMGSPVRLLPLAAQALAQGAAVAIYAQTAPTGLPEEVEVLPLDLLPEAPDWADFLALEADLRDLPTIRSRLGLAPYQNPSCQTQLLVRASMPCTGMGNCGVCAVETRQGWSLACEDGPVYDFTQLEGL